MALTKDQYERLIAAAERIATALEGAAGDVGHIVSTLDEPPVEEQPEPEAVPVAETEAPAPETEAAPEDPIAETEASATETDGIYTQEKLEELNEWLFQCATWMGQNGKGGISQVVDVLAKHGVNQTSEIKTAAQYDGVVADVTAMMGGQ